MAEHPPVSMPLKINYLLQYFDEVQDKNMNICILFHSHAKISLKYPKSYNKRGKHSVLKNGEGCASLTRHDRNFLEVEVDHGWADREHLATHCKHLFISA